MEKRIEDLRARLEQTIAAVKTLMEEHLPNDENLQRAIELGEECADALMDAEVADRRKAYETWKRQNIVR